MNYAELLHDQASLDRGSEVVEAFVEAFTQLRNRENGSNHFQQELDRLLDEKLGQELSDKEYAAIGRQVMDARPQIIELGRIPAVQEVYYRPVYDLLAKYAGRQAVAVPFGEMSKNAYLWVDGGLRWGKRAKVQGRVENRTWAYSGMYIDGRRIEVFNAPNFDGTTASIDREAILAIGE